MMRRLTTASFRACAIFLALGALIRLEAQEASTVITPNADAPVRIEEDARAYTLDNGLVRARVEKRTGMLRSLRYQGLELLARRASGASGGYWSSVGRARAGSRKSARLLTNPADNGGDRAVISCRSFNDPDDPDGMMDVDICYALGRGEHWIYTYAVWDHRPGWAAFSVGEARYALKLNPDVFDFMTIDADRRKIMPTGEDWDRGEPLNLKEARRLTTGRYQGQPEHKYGYSAVLHETPAYGWSSTTNRVGLWIVNPSMEYIAGGPTKAELTGHLDVNPGGSPTLLNMWLGSHYGGSSLAVGQEESWTKVIGPFLIYCNSAPDHDRMWEDALARAASETAAWPYAWVADPDYPPAAQRSVVSGRIVLHDPYVAGSQMSNLWVGLTAPDYRQRSFRSSSGRRPRFEPNVDWQRDAKHYQFWVQADKNGRFIIPAVRPGTYWLHAIADGVLGEFTDTNIVVSAGGEMLLGDLEWTPVRHGRPLWEIGIPNRTAVEFRNGSRAWQWGTYLEYPGDFPNDVNFVIGRSDWQRDWNYVQPPRILERNRGTSGEGGEDTIPIRRLSRAEVESTPWSVKFEVPTPVQGRATLRLAFCGTHRGCRVEVLVNGESIGDTGVLPSTSAMQRDSARAYWIEKKLPFDASMLNRGWNTIQLLSHATTWSQGVMYDYLRLEIENDGNPGTLPQRFDFGTGPVESGWTRVAPDLDYGAGIGYGFDLSSRPDSVDRGGENPLQSDFITSPDPFYFSVPLPEGNYDVTVTFGDGERASTNTVKAESRRLMLERVVTFPGEFRTRTFTVNVRTPALPDGRSVGLKEREKGVLHWDDKLTVEFNGSRPAVCGMEIIPVTNAITVFLLGDSTVTDQPREPWNSWGQMLTRFFEPGVAVANHAESGESLRSSLSARRVEKVFASMQPGDYVFVQFGHNDMKDRASGALATYRANLEKLVSEVRTRGGTPVLITSMERKAGLRSDTLAGYPETVREVAGRGQVALIDLHAMSKVLYAALGDDLDQAFQDGTHHNAYGSYLLAKCVVEGIRQNNLPLAGYLVSDLPPFDLTSPDSPEAFDVPASPSSSEMKPDGS